MAGIAALAERWATISARIPAVVRARVLADARVIRLPGNVPPWTDTGLRVARGDEVTILAEGKIVTLEAANLWYRPRFALWARVGERGPIWTGTRDTQSFRAATEGTLQLAVYNGEWKSPDGVLATPLDAYAAASGAIDALILHWRGEARVGLEALERAAAGEPLFEDELARLRAPATRPGGWSYLWFLGQSDVFRSERGEGRHQIACRCEDDVAILRRPIDLPLTADSEVSWRWKIDELPSRAAEDTLLCHDYLSVALEFENGRDLTWFWSSCLPVGTHFACPIPQWNPRETHLAVRTGRDGLGQWQSERRRVAEDYALAIGGPTPQRIVAVWLIAVSLFQHGRGIAEFAEIEVKSGDQRVEVVNG